MKRHLTVDLLKEEARNFAEWESAHKEKALQSASCLLMKYKLRNSPRRS